MYVNNVYCICCSGDKTGECDSEMPASNVDVSYFRNLIRTQTDRLKLLCAVWRSTIEDLPDLSDEGNLRPFAYFDFNLVALECLCFWHFCQVR